jgi:uncharacterized iron-regulated membrane protein
MNFRSAFLWIHRYLGLLAALPIVLLAVSGAVLTFEVEIDRALNPGYWRVTPRGQAMGWEAIAAAVRRNSPGEPPQSVRFPTAPDVAAEFTLKGGRMISVDPYTASVLGSRRRNGGNGLLGPARSFFWSWAPAVWCYGGDARGWRSSGRHPGAA